MEQSVQHIIEKWYRELNFPQKFDDEFYAALQSVEIDEGSTVENFDPEEENGKKSLLSCLYFCEALKKKYEEKGIPMEVLYDTLHDLVVWTETWSDVKGELAMLEQGWLERHLSMKLFKLGRLQFSPGKAEMDIPALGITKGDPMMEIHIPAVGPLDQEECLKSIERAKEFFAKYDPDYQYRYFTCHSWLLDTSLKQLLGETSNIIRFQNMFAVLCEEKSDAILRYVFRWDCTREMLPQMPCSSGFAKKVKELTLAGQEFHVSYGVIR